MREQSKAAQRRKFDWGFNNLYFVGDGIDVGCGPDSMRHTMHLFPKITSITEYDRQHGDAQMMANIEDESFDFLHASHILEHVGSPLIALENWARVIRNGGHLIITVPDWGMYEHRHWPSQFSTEHLSAWTSDRKECWFSRDDVPLFMAQDCVIGTVILERLVVIRDNFDPMIVTDQTLGPAECAIEIVLRKWP